MDGQSIVDEIAGEEDVLEESQAPEEEAQEESQAVEAKEAAKTVPLTALQEARHETRDFREQLQQANERMAKMEVVYDQLRGYMANQAAEETKVSFDDDPEQYVNGVASSLDNRVRAVEQRDIERRQQEEAVGTQDHLINQYAASVRTFSNAHPDFQEAYTFLSKSVDDELKVRGISDPTERANIIVYEEGTMVGRAMREGRDPAEMMYDFARHRGFKANGQEDGKLDQLKKGAEASKSLSGTGKGEGSMTLSRLSELADSDPEAFDREFEKAKRQGLLG
jgi:uncharacterized protein (DUF1810 family)